MSAITEQHQVHRLAISQDLPTIAQALQETLGQRIAAYAVGVHDPKAIGKYASGVRQPHQHVEAALRDLFQVSRLLLAHEQADTVRAWMIGSNPQLEDRAPLEVFHAGDRQSVIRAALAFADGG